MMKAVCSIILLMMSAISYATDYFIHATKGKDSNSGLSVNSPWQSLGKANQIKFKAGDRLLLAEGEEFYGSLELADIQGSLEKPIIVSTYSTNQNSSSKKALINAKGVIAGIVLTDSSYVDISNISISANRHISILGDGMFIVSTSRWHDYFFRTHYCYVYAIRTYHPRFITKY